MDSVSEERWADLAKAVRDRRLELGLSLRAAGPAAGFNRVTWMALENGESRLSERLWAGVERALAWAPGSVAAILAGGEPTVATKQAPAEPLLATDEEIQLVIGDERLSDEMKVRIIRLIHERRAASLAETRRMIQTFRDVG